MEKYMKSLTLNITLDGKQVELSSKSVADMFHHIYYGSRVWEKTYYFGSHILKCPLDMWIYQEIFHEIKPDYLIETGTFHGGSALYYAHLFDLMSNGKVITIDIESRPDMPVHDRIEFVNASSADVNEFDAIKERIGLEKKVIVVLDSDHSMKHVYEEMKLWSDLVSINSYMIVEDSNVNGHPVRPDFGAGPMEAIDKFLSEDNRFVIDESREKFFMTQNPCGYLKKIRN
jgi:cephalosporin hydroxylase